MQIEHKKDQTACIYIYIYKHTHTQSED